MSLKITAVAAHYILARVRKDQLPLRLSRKIMNCCGNISPRFERSARQLPGDTLVEAYGLALVCDLTLYPEFADVSVDLYLGKEGLFLSEKVVVIPDGAQLCGCGASIVK